MTRETRTSATEGRLSPNNNDEGVNNYIVKKSKQYLPKNATIFVGLELPNQLSTQEWLSSP
jgi:hypothetical protein